MFDAGITAIVGPNGSGKSNIADAIRWVLGEQSYTALRGNRTEDMIFAGTSRRPQMGMAEAVMTLDNTSQWLPLDFAEVTITRRAYRSGENRYFVNGNRTRLRDLAELLGKVGLGRRGFVVIGQGLVDAALSLRPQERRVLFEEAAGILVYREKRTDALNNLAETQQNMLRVNDILNEITPRVRELQRQAKRAEEYDLLSRDLEKLLRIWYGYQWQRREASLTEAEASLQRRVHDLELGRARMHETEALITSTQTRQGELRTQLSVWHRASGDLHAQAEVTGRELAVSQERLTLLLQHIEELQAELSELRAGSSAVDENLAAAKAERQSLQEEIDTLATQLQELRSQWVQADTVRSELEQTVDARRAETFRVATLLADARNRKKEATERRSQITAEWKGQHNELVEAQEALSDLAGQIAQVKRQADDLLQVQEAAATRHRGLQDEQAVLEAERKQRTEVSAQARLKRERLEDRRDMLGELRQSMAGFAPGVKAVLRSKERLSGVVGPVSGLLRVSRKYECAVEAALGRYAQALVVESREDAEAAIDVLRRESAGSATFLPLDSITIPGQVKAPRGEGMLGPAQHLVECDGPYQSIAQVLLGQAFVVEDLPTAQRIRSQLRTGQRLVTLAGELVEASGAITGGSGSGRGRLLAQEREWRELPDKLATLQRDQQMAEQALESLQHKLAINQQALTEIAAELSHLSGEREAVLSTLTELQHKLERLEQEVEWRRRLDEQQQRELQALDDKAAQLEQDLDKHSKEHSELKASLSQLLTQLDSARQAADAKRQALTDAETALAIRRRQLEAQEQLLSSQEANADRFKEQMGAKQERADDLQHESDELRARVQKLREASESQSAELAVLATQIEPAEAELLILERQLVELERDLAGSRQRLSELQSLHNQQVLEKERCHDALEALERRIEEDLGDIHYPSERVQQLRLEFLGRGPQLLAPTSVLPENLSADIRDLKARMRRLGSINPNAPQEYREVVQRQEFLDSQITDLEQSATSLQHVIKELDQVMEEEFLSVFSVAAREFGHYFKTLFGGGEARLALTDAASVASSGVEIFAQPPGKRQQSLALLSSGERALTATALLFAVLKARPLPFCLLDEVDAMLDEANVGRFRALLEEFAEQTQFIVITHNRRTVEAANTIYGVSMRADGISQVVSLRLEGEKLSTG
jgi:chromosome segregation protein